MEDAVHVSHGHRDLIVHDGALRLLERFFESRWEVSAGLHFDEDFIQVEVERRCVYLFQEAWREVR